MESIRSVPARSTHAVMSEAPAFVLLLSSSKSEVGGRESNRKIVSCRAVRPCARARGLVRIRSDPPAATFPCPFCHGRSSLFTWGI